MSVLHRKTNTYPQQVDWFLEKFSKGTLLLSSNTATIQRMWSSEFSDLKYTWACLWIARCLHQNLSIRAILEDLEKENLEGAEKDKLTWALFIKSRGTVKSSEIDETVLHHFKEHPSPAHVQIWTVIIPKRFPMEKVFDMWDEWADEVLAKYQDKQEGGFLG